MMKANVQLRPKRKMLLGSPSNSRIVRYAEGSTETASRKNVNAISWFHRMCSGLKMLGNTCWTSFFPRENIRGRNYFHGTRQSELPYFVKIRVNRSDVLIERWPGLGLGPGRKTATLCWKVTSI